MSESKMTPWVIDAKDLDLAVLSGFRKSLFHTNATVDRFLGLTNGSVILVSGPKGFGKTLLLKLKKDSLRRKGGFHLIPVDQMVDRPIGTPTIFSLKDSIDFLQDEQYWRNVWLISLTSTFIKHDKGVNIASLIGNLTSPSLQSMMNREKLTSACDMFDQILAMPRKDYIYAYNDLRTYFIPAFRAIRSPMAIFIDNIDEYFEQAIAFRDNATLTRNVAHSFWINAQLGLANAARELNALNNHIKIFATIRQEVFQTTRKIDPLAMQLRASTIELSYEHDDLVEIIRKNIGVEVKENLVEPSAPDEIERFIGKSNLTIEHRYTNEDESFEDFLIRHTLMRPRDIAALGGKISEIPPSRRSVSKIRDTINSESAIVAEMYLAESRPHVADFSIEVLFPLLQTNVINRDELESISDQYDTAMARLSLVDKKELHVFCDLFRLGLLGVVQDNKKTEMKTQFFVRLGETALDPKRCLPHSDIYLIHPIMYDFIGKFNAKFINSINSLNIVGKGRPWREITDVYFVIKADVVKYSEIMADPDLADTFPKEFSKIVASEGGSLFQCEVSSGDSITIIDRNWKNASRAFHRIDAKLQKSIFKRRLRGGGDSGIIRFDSNESGKPDKFRGGALRTAARIEPVSNPGQLVVTSRYKEFAQTFGPADFRELEAGELPKARALGGQFDLAKSDSEPSIIERLFVFRSK